MNTNTTFKMSYLQPVANDLKIAYLIQITIRWKCPQEGGCIATLNDNTNALNKIKTSSRVKHRFYQSPWRNAKSPCTPRSQSQPRKVQIYKLCQDLHICAFCDPQTNRQLHRPALMSRIDEMVQGYQYPS